MSRPAGRVGAAVLRQACVQTGWAETRAGPTREEEPQKGLEKRTARGLQGKETT